MKTKLKKFLKIAGITIGGLLLLLVLTILFWLGPTVKLLVQTIGPKALGTEIQIEKLKVNPIKGVISLTDFTIKNPDIFGQSNAVSLASLDLSVDMASLFSSTIIVHQVEINSPYFIYEQDLQSDNITEFIRNVQAFAKIDPEAPPKPKKEEKPEKEKKLPPVVIVEQLAINDVRFNLANTQDDKLDIGVGFESLTISMTNGTVFLDNVYVNNPGRLETPHLFTLDGVHIEMEPGSIYSTNIHFKSVEILNPHAFIEHNPETDTLGEFLKIASSLTAKIPTNAPNPTVTNEEIPAAPASPPPTLTLDLFVIDDVQVHAVNIGSPELDVMLGMNYFSVELEKGKIGMDHLYLSNPARLSTPNVFSLERFALQLEPGSHRTGTFVIEDVQIIKPNTFLELTTNCNTVSEFLRIANGFIERIPTYQMPQFPAAPEQPTADDDETSVSTHSPPPFELHNLVIDDIDLYLLDGTDTNYPSHTPRLLAGIDEAALQLTEGRLSVRNIRMPNGPGYNASNLFHLAQIAVSIDAATLHSKQVVIDEVFIDTPKVNLEQTETSGNVAALQAALMQFIPAPEQLPQFPGSTNQVISSEEPAAAAPPVPIAEQPVVLHHLLATNLAVNLILPVSTNQNDGMMSALNPMEYVSLSKLNPMEAGAPPEEIDPNEPMSLIAFDLLSVEPLKGLIYINNMRISNPPGFSRRNLVQFEQFRFDIDPDSLQTDTLHIEDILIQKPRIRYERQIKTDNLKALQAEIETATMRRQEQMGTGTNTVQTAQSQAPDEPAENEQKVIIDRILIPGGLVQAKLSALPSIPVPLPTIEINDLGKEEGGATLADANETVFNTLYDAIIGAVGNTTGFATDALKGFGGLTFDAMGNALGGVSDGIGNVTRGTAEAVEETFEKAKSRRKRRAGGRRSAVH